ncbi:MAG: OmpA family protein [Bacteroidales bacterium]
MKRTTLLLVGIIFTYGLIHSQNTEHPWLVGVSTNFVDFHAVEQPLEDQFTDTDWMGDPIPAMLRVGRALNSSFSVSILSSFAKLEVDKLNSLPLERQISDDSFWKLGGQVEYSFANGYLLNESSWFVPYLLLGMNSSKVSKVSYLSASMGVGVNFWINKNLGLNFQGSYDYLFDFNDYMNFNIGLVARFGKGPDDDNDGIPNKKDACPDVPGPEIYNGCPDSDGDGIIDKEDKCPNEAGLAAFDGCPDSDGDGIPDYKDACPSVAGLEKFDGCPDRDNDGIPDDKDQCPDIAGLAEFNGCPDSDGDGIPDHMDNCPNEAGVAANDGCPEKPAEIVPAEVMDEIEFAAKSIEFDFNSSKIKAESHDKLDKIIEIMKEYPTARFTVYGYTDKVGSPSYNLTLSEERAKSVKDYFVKHGIDEYRLESGGFGEKNPIAPNTTEEGRAKNRRVEIKLVK